VVEMREIKDGTRFTNSHWKAVGSKKPIICIDFDHTITTKCLACSDGLEGNALQVGAKEAIIELSKDFQIYIYTGSKKYIKAGNPIQRSVSDIKRFLVNNEIPFDKILQTKPPACFIIDDRAVHHASWAQTLSEIKLRMKL